MAVSSICRYYVNYQLKRMVICTVLLLLFRSCRIKLGFSHSSVGKEPTCSARNYSSIPGSGRLDGEGRGCPLQHSQASLVAQLVKNLPSMWETWFNSWVGKIPWRMERLPTAVFWPGEFHGLYSLWGHKESDTTEELSLSHFKKPL